MEDWTGWRYKQDGGAAGSVQPRFTYFNPSTNNLQQFELDDGVKDHPDVWFREQEFKEAAMVWKSWIPMPKIPGGSKKLVWVTAHFDGIAGRVEVFAITADGVLLCCKQLVQALLTWEANWLPVSIRADTTNVRFSEVQAVSRTDGATELYLLTRQSSIIRFRRSDPTAVWGPNTDGTSGTLKGNARCLVAISVGDKNVRQILCLDQATSTKVRFAFVDDQTPFPLRNWQQLAFVGSSSNVVDALAAVPDSQGCLSVFALTSFGTVWCQTQVSANRFLPNASWVRVKNAGENPPAFTAISAGWGAQDSRIFVSALTADGQVYENARAALAQTQFVGWTFIPPKPGQVPAGQPDLFTLLAVGDKTNTNWTVDPNVSDGPATSLCGQYCGSVRTILSTCYQPGPSNTSTRYLGCRQVRPPPVYNSPDEQFDCTYCTVGQLFEPNARNTAEVMKIYTDGWSPELKKNFTGKEIVVELPTLMLTIMQKTTRKPKLLEPGERFRFPEHTGDVFMGSIKYTPDIDRKEPPFTKWQELEAALNLDKSKKAGTIFTIEVNYKQLQKDIPASGHALQCRVNQQEELEFYDFQYVRKWPYLSYGNARVKNVPAFLSQVGSKFTVESYRYITHLPLPPMPPPTPVPLPVVPPKNLSPAPNIEVLTSLNSREHEPIARCLTSVQRFYQPPIADRPAELDLIAYISLLRNFNSSASLKTDVQQYSARRALPSKIAILANRVRIKSDFLDLRTGSIQPPVSLDIECQVLVVAAKAEIDLSGSAEDKLLAKVQPDFAGFDAGSIRIRYQELEEISQGSTPSPAPLVLISARGGAGAGNTRGRCGVIDIIGPDVFRLVGPAANGVLNGEEIAAYSASAAAAASSSSSSSSSSSQSAPKTGDATYELHDTSKAPVPWTSFSQTTADDLSHAVRLLQVQTASLVGAAKSRREGDVSAKLKTAEDADTAFASDLDLIRELVKGEVTWLANWADALGYPAVPKNVQLLRTLLNSDDSMVSMSLAARPRAAVMTVGSFTALLNAFKPASGAPILETWLVGKTLDQLAASYKDDIKWVNDSAAALGQAKPPFPATHDEYLSSQLDSKATSLASLAAALDAKVKPASADPLAVLLRLMDGFDVQKLPATPDHFQNTETRVVLQTQPNNPQDSSRLTERRHVSPAEAATLLGISPQNIDELAKLHVSVNKLSLEQKLRLHALEPAVAAVVQSLTVFRSWDVAVKRATLIKGCRDLLQRSVQSSAQGQPGFVGISSAAPAPSSDDVQKNKAVLLSLQPAPNPNPSPNSNPPPTFGALTFVGRLESVDYIDRAPADDPRGSTPGLPWLQLKFDALELRHHGLQVADVMDSYVIRFELPDASNILGRGIGAGTRGPAFENQVGMYLQFTVRTRAPDDNLTDYNLGRNVSLCHYQRACDPTMSLVMRAADPEYEAYPNAPVEFVATNLQRLPNDVSPDRLQPSDLTGAASDADLRAVLGPAPPPTSVNSLRFYNAGGGSLHVLKNRTTVGAWLFDAGCSFAGENSTNSAEAVLAALSVEQGPVNVVLSQWDTCHFKLATMPFDRPRSDQPVPAQDALLSQTCPLWIAPMEGITGDTSLNMARQAAAAARAARGALLLVGVPSVDNAPDSSNPQHPQVVRALDGRDGVLPIVDLEILRAWLPSNLQVGTCLRFVDYKNSLLSGARAKHNSGTLFGVVTGQVNGGPFKLLLPGDASFSFIPAQVGDLQPKDALTVLEATNHGLRQSILVRDGSQPALPKSLFLNAALENLPDTDIPIFDAKKTRASDAVGVLVRTDISDAAWKPVERAYKNAAAAYPPPEKKLQGWQPLRVPRPSAGNAIEIKLD